MDSAKSELGHVTLNLCLCIRWDACHVVHSGVPGA
jgi:hypothetical protein